MGGKIGEGEEGKSPRSRGLGDAEKADQRERERERSEAGRQALSDLR